MPLTQRGAPRSGAGVWDLPPSSVHAPTLADAGVALGRLVGTVRVTPRDVLTQDRTRAEGRREAGGGGGGLGELSVALTRRLLTLWERKTGGSETPSTAGSLQGQTVHREDARSSSGAVGLGLWAKAAVSARLTSGRVPDWLSSVRRLLAAPPLREDPPQSHLPPITACPPGRAPRPPPLQQGDLRQEGSGQVWTGEAGMSFQSRKSWSMSAASCNYSLTWSRGGRLSPRAPTTTGRAEDAAVPASLQATHLRGCTGSRRHGNRGHSGRRRSPACWSRWR